MRTVTPVPSDPRTWASFNHVGLRGFRKVSCETRLEAVTTRIGFGFAMLGAFWMWSLYVRAHFGLADPAAVVGDWRPAAMVVAGLGLLAVRLMTDNFYLIDPKRRLTYLHVELGPFRRVRLLSSGPSSDGRCADSV